MNLEAHQLRVVNKGILLDEGKVVQEYPDHKRVI